MRVERNKINGSVAVTDIINNQLVTKVYYGYTKKEAEKMFKKEFKTEAVNEKEALQSMDQSRYGKNR